MLQAEHTGIRYGKPVLAKVRSRRAGGVVVPDFPSVHQPMGETDAPDTRPLGDAGMLTLDEFVALFLDTRDELAYRRLSGDTLSFREAVLLATLNQLLEQLLPAPKPLPRHVTDLVDEVLRRR